MKQTTLDDRLLNSKRTWGGTEGNPFKKNAPGLYIYLSDGDVYNRRPRMII